MTIHFKYSPITQINTNIHSFIEPVELVAESISWQWNCRCLQIWSEGSQPSTLVALATSAFILQEEILLIIYSDWDHRHARTQSPHTCFSTHIPTFPICTLVLNMLLSASSGTCLHTWYGYYGFVLVFMILSLLFHFADSHLFPYFCECPQWGHTFAVDLWSSVTMESYLSIRVQIMPRFWCTKCWVCVWWVMARGYGIPKSCIVLSGWLMIRFPGKVSINVFNPTVRLVSPVAIDRQTSFDKWNINLQCNTETIYTYIWQSVILFINNGANVMSGH